MSYYFNTNGIWGAEIMRFGPGVLGPLDKKVNFHVCYMQVYLIHIIIIVEAVLSAHQNLALAMSTTT